MKKWFLIWLAPLFVLAGHESPPFPLYKETSHFQVYCNEAEQISADLLLIEGESYFTKLSSAFRYEYPKTISLVIYPSVEKFHEAIESPNAPSWQVTTARKNQILIVSPQNPGPNHNQRTLIRCEIASLSKIFIRAKYTNLPQWLSQGVAFYLSDFYSYPQSRVWVQEIAEIPSFTELEWGEETVEKASSYNRYAFTLVDFIKQKWGWEKILALMEDYASFEKILGISKEECRKEWILSLEKNPLISFRKNLSN